MLATLGLLLFLSHPFWESRPPEKWTDHEIDTILHASPWCQAVGPDPEVLVYLATAAPIEEAEGELRVRSRHPLGEPDPDYVDYLRQNGADSFILAIRWPAAGFGTEHERKRMENESAMVIGKKSYPILGHFPPTTTDPVLRLVFPRREWKPADKSVVFRLYLPGLPFPEREARFWVKDLMYHGKLEM